MLNILEQRSPQEIGERLRMARSRSGFTQEDVSQKLNIARTTLVAIEKGQRRVRPNELREMAELYQIPINTLFRNTAIHVDLVPRFRALAQTDEVSGMKAAQMLNSLAAAEVELEQRLGQPLKMNYPPEYPIQAGDLRAQAEDVAMEMRHRFGIGLSPIVDVVSLLELEVGVRIFVRPLPNSSISGLFVFDEQLGGCMLLNQNHPRERRAISGSHEFGHFVSVRKSPDMVDLAHAPQTREDRFANYFAMAFMMPAIVIRRKFQEMKQEAGRFSPRHLILLAHYFNVSEEALCRRLEDLELIPSGAWDSLRDRGFSGETVRQVLGDRAEKNDAVMPPRLWLLAAEAYRKEIFDEGQLAKMLCMDRIELRSLLDTMDVEGNDDLQSAPSH